MRSASESLVCGAAVTTTLIQRIDLLFRQFARKQFASEMTVEPITVWTAFATFVFGMFVGVLIVKREAKRAQRRWREAKRTWHEIELAAVEHRDEFKELPQHNAPMWWQRIVMNGAAAPAHPQNRSATFCPLWSLRPQLPGCSSTKGGETDILSRRSGSMRPFRRKTIKKLQSWLQS